MPACESRNGAPTRGGQNESAESIRWVNADVRAGGRRERRQQGRSIQEVLPPGGGVQDARTRIRVVRHLSSPRESGPLLRADEPEASVPPRPSSDARREVSGQAADRAA